MSWLVCLGLLLQVVSLVGIYMLLQRECQPKQEAMPTVEAPEAVPELPKDKHKPKKRPRTMTEVLNEAELKSQEEAHR